LSNNAKKSRNYLIILLSLLSTVLISEFVLRIFEPKDLVRFPLSVEQQYKAAKLFVKYYGAGDISVLGSSKVREGINVAQFEDLCQQNGGCSCRFRNFGLPGATAVEVEYFFRFMVSERKLPRLIIVGISPSFLGDRQAPKKTIMMFLDTLSLMHIKYRLGEFRTLVSEVIKRLLADYLYLFKFRQFVPDIITRVLAGKSEKSSIPMLGQESFWQKNRPRAEILNDNLKTENRIKDLINKTITRNSITMRRQQWSSLLRILKLSKKLNIELLFVEMPIPKKVKDKFPIGVYDSWLLKITNLFKTKGFEFLKNQEIDFRDNNEFFREHIHLGWMGHRLFTENLFKKIMNKQSVKECLYSEP